MADLCGYSLLPTRACHHCTTDPADDPQSEPSSIFIARYDGHCENDCGWPIEAGERIRYTADGGIVHARCGDV